MIITLLERKEIKLKLVLLNLIVINFIFSCVINRFLYTNVLINLKRKDE